MSGETIRKLFNEEVSEFEREKNDKFDRVGKTADEIKTALEAIKNEVKLKRLEVAKSFFEKHTLPDKSEAYGISKVRKYDGTDADVTVKGPDAKGKIVTLNYDQVLEIETNKLLASAAFQSSPTELNEEGKSRLAINLINNWGGKFEDALVEIKAKEVADANIEVYRASAEIQREINDAKDPKHGPDGREPHTDSLDTAKTTAEGTRDELEASVIETFPGMFKEPHQDRIRDAIILRAQVLEQKWAADESKTAHLANENEPLPGYLTGKYDPKKISSTMSLEESKKEYENLVSVGVFSDDWATYKAAAVAKLAGRKQFKDDDGKDGLNSSGRAELAKQIGTKVTEKKRRFFSKFEKGFDLQKKWYEAALEVVDAPESDYRKRNNASKKEAKAQADLQAFEAKIPDAYKDEMLLVLKGRAGKFLDDAKFKKLHENFDGFDLDEESYKKLREDAKNLKGYEEKEKAKAEGKPAPDGKGSGKGWMAAAALAGAAIAGTAALTGEDKVENVGKENETRNSKWTFGRVIATVVGVITLGLAVEGLARGDKSFVGKYMAEKGAKSTSALTGLINGRG
jgi:hypothetical protein